MRGEVASQQRKKCLPRINVLAEKLYFWSPRRTTGMVALTWGSLGNLLLLRIFWHLFFRYLELERALNHLSETKKYTCRYKGEGQNCALQWKAGFSEYI